MTDEHDLDQARAASFSIFIEFDKQQLIVRTNSDAVGKFLSSIFERMLVSSAPNPCGSLDMFVIREGFWLGTNPVIDLKRASVDEMRPLLKDEVHMHFMRARPDLLWLHAGVVERGGEAMLIAGRTGQGKSTMSTHLIERGWNFMSDDIAPVRMDADEVLPFAQAPSRRMHPGHEVETHRVGAIQREEIVVAADRWSSKPARIRRGVFLKYIAGANAELNVISPATGAFELLHSAFNLVDHKDAAVQRAVRLAEQVQFFTLTYSESTQAVELLASVPT